MVSLKDIAKYWLYDLTVNYDNGHGEELEIKINGIKKGSRKDEVILLNDKVIPLYLHECQPNLRPLSQLIEEIEHNGERFVPIVELAKIGIDDSQYPDWSKIRIEEKDKHQIPLRLWFDCVNGRAYDFESWFFYLKGAFFVECHDEDVHYEVRNQEQLFQKLYEWHFWTGDQSFFKKGLLIEKK